MPAMPTAAGTRAVWARGAATHSWSFLTKILAGGLFWHFTRRGGLIRQKFQLLDGFARGFREQGMVATDRGVRRSVWQRLVCEAFDANNPNPKSGHFPIVN
jgi:hypothetical protein